MRYAGAGDHVPGVGTGGHKGRPYVPVFEFTYDVGTGVVGDGLVPSRFESRQDGTGFVPSLADYSHDSGTGGDEPRPYRKYTNCRNAWVPPPLVTASTTGTPPNSSPSSPSTVVMPICIRVKSDGS